MTSHVTPHSSACCQHHQQCLQSPLEPSKPEFQVPAWWRGRQEHSADRPELLLLHFRTIPGAFQSRASFKSSFAISVKVLFIQLTCNMFGARWERVAGPTSARCPRAVLYYQSVFIAVFTFTGTALPGVGSLWTMHASATCITPPRFAKPCPRVAKGSSGQLPRALWGLESTNYEAENVWSS